jgi:hypothetical protein
MDADDREIREAERKHRKAEREESQSEEKAIGDWFDDIQTVADAAMLEAGFHNHKGEWRRKRRWRSRSSTRSTKLVLNSVRPTEPSSKSAS